MEPRDYYRSAKDPGKQLMQELDDMAAVMARSDDTKGYYETLMKTIRELTKLDNQTEHLFSEMRMCGRHDRLDTRSEFQEPNQLLLPANVRSVEIKF